MTNGVVMVEAAKLRGRPRWRKGEIRLRRENERGWQKRRGQRFHANASAERKDRNETHTREYMKVPTECLR